MENNKDFVKISEEEVIVSFEVTADKPFNKCFECRSLRNGCSGPNLSVMGVEKACEFLQMARIFLDYTYQDVADGTGLSLATVKRILTGKISNPDFYSISAISVCLLGDPTGRYPCAIPNVSADPENAAKLNEALRELERAMADNQDYRVALDNIHNAYATEIQQIRAASQRKLDYLLAQIERLQKDNDNLWAENNRKSKLVDMFWAKQNIKIIDAEQ